MVSVNYEAFLKKVYTVAFRLTGDEETASDLTLHSLTRTAQEFGWHPTEPVPSNMTLSSVIEVCRTFLAESKFWSGKATNPFSKTFHDRNEKEVIVQEVILTLRPLERVTIIWRNILGFQIIDMIPVTNRPKEELCSILSCARRQLMSQLKLAGLVSTN